VNSPITHPLGHGIHHNDIVTMTDSDVARIWCEEGATKIHEMTRNDTLNKVHVAATELPQLLSHNTNMFVEATAQSRCRTLCSSKVN